VTVGTLSLHTRDIVEPAQRYGSVEPIGNPTGRLGIETHVDGVATYALDGKPAQLSSTFAKALTEWQGIKVLPGSPDVTCGALRTPGDPQTHVPKTPPLHSDHTTAAVIIAPPDAGVSIRSAWSQRAGAACEARDAYVLNRPSSRRRPGVLAAHASRDSGAQLISLGF
jgi:hypothetical protein